MAATAISNVIGKASINAGKAENINPQSMLFILDFHRRFLMLCFCCDIFFKVLFRQLFQRAVFSQVFNGFVYFFADFIVSRIFRKRESDFS